ncbi:MULTISPECIES: hypothetical protein [unclassified Microcella]|uniref:hypothetical protein n=1 Tax=unclassified Microcella TaxID=2630066 RepID=UPI0006FFD153|nr:MULTISPECIES: hypothetical protein [unclassified Microcella]KQV26624.1 hypothetical protein ASC54_07150 [Yonghaparkia sp. Root332]KRF32598.1 hypothetical protein ASG83_00580 [Yonghaparkia sp. Soil809]
MSLTSLLIASEELAPLIAPPLVIAGVAALAFLMMGIVTFTYRDVANRHAGKGPARGHDAGHDGGHH